MKVLFPCTIILLIVFSIWLCNQSEYIASGIFFLVAIFLSLDWNDPKKKQGNQFFLLVDNKDKGSLYINRDAIDSIHRAGMSIIISTRGVRIAANSPYDKTEEDTEKRMQKLVAQLNGEAE